MNEPYYRCPILGCTRPGPFVSERGLNQHYSRNHGGPRPVKVKCPQDSCKFSARSIIEVENHITTVHTRCVLQYYMCPAPKCNFMSTIVADMTAHRRDDHGIKIEAPITTAASPSSSSASSAQSTSMYTHSTSSRVSAGSSTQMNPTYGAPIQIHPPIRTLPSGEVGLLCGDVASGHTDLNRVIWYDFEPEEEGLYRFGYFGLQEQEQRQRHD
ncbi:hypothetical protein D9758_008094 [Tetrapyrgos nigripes]|uniref:C2H2-type domain-containing protein n=1 Tax=Tetrapyrgos nigripes TaxID=182062 RepID=A0A8H5GHD6_9AGAR|nr:hypothetical protein D9758_008094 [Tetrapyrgos nigripes]